MPHKNALELALAVQDAAIVAALQGYENAAISGLCHEGAWEAAISAIRMMDLDALVADEPAKRGQQP
ncbi:hypothetical protein [Marinobacterium sedimentorum]|jgi:hypothetical protein|uniref:hypothetical protein n=1 Tax=Marinobacterium sedimentorum TaxID=2927804 RepID=UPI0020C61557|nr:hypothetical protein [Marinobacterium sedimentorum]MCP8689776.1 hypothetical protein [Marinobacterium sedimentorum]